MVNLGRVNTGDGSAALAGANAKYASRFTVGGSNLTVSYGYIAFATTSAGAKVKMVIYSASAGEPDGLVATSNEVTGTTAKALAKFTFASPPTLTASTQYYLGYIIDTGSISVYRQSSGGASRWNSDTYSDGPTDPFGADTHVTTEACLFVSDTDLDTTTRVSKGAAYAVIKPPDAGVLVAKALSYAVIETPRLGVSASKALAYAVLVPGGPTAPTNVVCTPGAGKNTISWDAVSGATSYNLYWGTDTGVTKANGTKIEGVTSPHDHTGLTPGQPYYYVVTALIDASESDDSAEVNGTPTLAAPANPSCTPGGEKNIIEWDAVVGATGYNLYWDTSPGVTKETGAQIASVTSPYVHTGLTIGQPYYYVVAAYRVGEESDESDEVTGTPTDYAKVSKVVGYAVVGPPDAALSVAKAVGYTVLRPPENAVSAAKTLSYAVIEPPDSMPDPPDWLIATPGNAQVVLEWADVLGYSSFTIYWDDEAGVTKADTAITHAESPFIVTDLVNGTQYFFRVSVTNDAGESDLSEEAAATPMAPISAMHQDWIT